MTLSKRQAGDADRVGGIEYMMLWPASLGPEPTDLPCGQEREASAAQKAAAEALVHAACETYGLVPVHVRLACVRRTADLESAPAQVRVHLSVILIGRRWVHASTSKRPRVVFAR